MIPFALSALRSLPWRWIGVGSLALAAAFGWWRADVWHDVATQRAETIKTQKAAYEAAQAAAHARAAIARIQTENSYAQAAHAADRVRQADGALRRAADLYARAHSLRAEAVEGGAGPAVAAGEGGPSKGGDGPSPAAELLAISRNDFEILVENSIRLRRVQEWGDDLVQRKLAIPEVEFGKLDPETTP